MATSGDVAEGGFVQVESREISAAEFSGHTSQCGSQISGLAP